MKATNRKSVSPETKIKILKLHLHEKKTISELSEEFGVKPSSIYQWQSQLFDNGAECFQRKRSSRGDSSDLSKLHGKIQALESKIASKDSVIGEVMEEIIKLKKLDGET